MCVKKMFQAFIDENPMSMSEKQNRSNMGFSVDLYEQACNKITARSIRL